MNPFVFPRSNHDRPRGKSATLNSSLSMQAILLWAKGCSQMLFRGVRFRGEVLPATDVGIGIFQEPASLVCKELEPVGDKSRSSSYSSLGVAAPTAQLLCTCSLTKGLRGHLKKAQGLYDALDLLRSDTISERQALYCTRFASESSVHHEQTLAPAASWRPPAECGDGRDHVLRNI